MRREGLPASGWENYYYHVNGLGTVTALTDSAKTVVQSYVYDSFGQIISQTGSIENPYTYTAREYNSETGLYYYRARYYDANVGRFISEDPIGIEGGINLYAYVGNNPVNNKDPDGLYPIPIPCDKVPPTFCGFYCCRKKDGSPDCKYKKCSPPKLPPGFCNIVTIPGCAILGCNQPVLGAICSIVSFLLCDDEIDDDIRTLNYNINFLLR